MDSAQRDLAIGFFAELPSSTLRQCVGDALLIDEDGYDQLRKQLPENLLQARQALATAIVDRHDTAGRIADLLSAAGRLVYWNRDHCERLMPLVRDLCGLDSSQQAALVARAHTLPLRQTTSKIELIAGHLCVIAATTGNGQARFGTGILVGKDCVLTAYYTLRDHIVQGQPNPVAGGGLCALFEHCGLAPISDPQRPPKGVVRVEFHSQWLLACCEDMPGDGMFAHPTKSQEQELTNRLDFALIRLAEPVGHHTRQFAGGKRRLWWNISDHVAGCLDDEQIIIPQHPQGMPQRISIGRYSQKDSELDTSCTRIRYDSEADKGSSGSPCFNQNFEFVGMHNAAFSPIGVAVRLNQAVRADRILNKLAACGQTLHAPDRTLDSDYVQMWSVSDDPASPRPILGRTDLLKWIKLAANDEQRDQAPCYFAYDASGDARNGIGLSFTAEILRAARAGAGSDEPIIVLGDGEDVPVNAEDFVATLAHHLRLPPSELRTLPQRPNAQSAMSPGLAATAADSFFAATDIDKLDRWKSSDLPDWLNLALRAREQPGQVASEPSRYRYVWIVLDNLHRAPLSTEVEELIAGLMRSDPNESALHPHLRGLRWLFLGAAPRVALNANTKHEPLDPMQVGETEIKSVFKGMCDSNDRHESEGEMASMSMEVWLKTPTADLVDPCLRLRVMQNHLGKIAALVYARYRKPT